jgi:hypothetical protein
MCKYFYGFIELIEEIMVHLELDSGSAYAWIRFGVAHLGSGSALAVEIRFQKP